MDQSPVDQAIIDIITSRDGHPTEVVLGDGTAYRVFNIAWGYDMGDTHAHVISNCSPFIEGEPIDVFFTSDIALIRDPVTEADLYRRPSA